MSVCIKSLIKNVNLIVGCDIGCPYCYARNNCRRFHMTDDFSKPVFFRNKLHLLDNKQPHVWFMTGLSDFTGWQPEWVDNIMRQTAARGIPTFMKADLVPIMGEERMIQQLQKAFIL